MDQAFFEKFSADALARITDHLDNFIGACADPGQLLIAVFISPDKDSITIESTTRDAMIDDLRHLSDAQTARDKIIATLLGKTQTNEIPVVLMGFSEGKTKFLQTASLHYHPGGFTGQRGEA